MKKMFILGMLSSSLLACSGGSDSPTAGLTYTAGGAALKVVTDSLAGAEGVLSSSIAPASTAPAVSYSLTSGLSDKWEVPNSYNNPKYDSVTCPGNSNMVTLKEYMGTQFDSNQVRCNGSSINIFGRLENAGGVLCIMMNLLSATTSAELATSAPKTFALDAATKTDLIAKCPMMAADLSSATLPASVTLTFAAPSNTNKYDLKITTSFNNTFLLKYGGNEISFANNEDNDNGNQRVIVSYDKTTQVLLAEYVSKAKASTYPVYVHRLFKDHLNRKIRIASAIQTGFSSSTATSATSSEKYIISGFHGVSNVGLSIDLVGQGNLSDGSHDACVNSETGVVYNDNPTVSSNAYDCGDAANANKSTAAFTAVGAINTAIGSGPTTWWNLSSGSEVLSWSTIDDMLTSGL